MRAGRPCAGCGTGRAGPGPAASRATRRRRGRRRTPLTCPLPELRSDPSLVTQTPDPEGREERVGEAQGQVRHGARAHPVQEAGRRQSALHGFPPRCKKQKQKKEREKLLNEQWKRDRPRRGGHAEEAPLGCRFWPKPRPQRPVRAAHWWSGLALCVTRQPLADSFHGPAHSPAPVRTRPRFRSRQAGGSCANQEPAPPPTSPRPQGFDLGRRVSACLSPASLSRVARSGRTLLPPASQAQAAGSSGLKLDWPRRRHARPRSVQCGADAPPCFRSHLFVQSCCIGVRGAVAVPSNCP